MSVHVVVERPETERGILRQITQLEQMTRAELQARWQELYGTETPGYRRDVLIKRLACRIQELAHGGVSEATRAKLSERLKRADKGQQRRRGADLPVTGTRLVRYWRGRRYEVTVVVGGYEFQGRRYRSLTAVAKAITGSHRSGRAFSRKAKEERAMREDTESGSAAALKPVRCAVYTRKSHAEGLEQDFNSLDAQREAAISYIASQRQSGWVLVAESYDDGGYSGATLDRPALQRLLRDVESGQIDCIVLYRLDRLCRSIVDFGRIVEILNRHAVAFVSVTEQFSTATPTGRLHLNMLASFAQYEREVIAERIRDKIRAAKRKGKHTGGTPVLGYDTDPAAKRLVVNEKEARLVRRIFRLYCDFTSASKVAEELNRTGEKTKSWTTKSGTTKGGRPWHETQVYSLLNNRKYLGESPIRETSTRVNTRPSWIANFGCPSGTPAESEVGVIIAVNADRFGPISTATAAYRAGVTGVPAGSRKYVYDEFDVLGLVIGNVRGVATRSAQTVL